MSCPILGKSKKKSSANQVYYYSLQEYPKRFATPNSATSDSSAGDSGRGQGLEGRSLLRDGLVAEVSEDTSDEDFSSGIYIAPGEIKAHTNGEEEGGDEQAEIQTEEEEADALTRAFHQALLAPKEEKGINLGPSGCCRKYMQQFTWHGLLRKYFVEGKYRLLCCGKLFGSSSGARDHIKKTHQREEQKYTYSAPHSKLVKL